MHTNRTKTTPNAEPALLPSRDGRRGLTALKMDSYLAAAIMYPPTSRAISNPYTTASEEHTYHLPISDQTNHCVENLEILRNSSKLPID
jgi:hypothetical protein